ncbi:hypothetical protein ACRALDRAFT_2033535 [Sodiomyces alcalophilus JCM 7366]|uniref:uncharacterized protein n=1 Tax=Sodiomyces alcalophilus JCM 7366 TaxID=591952 RepID=UPI0039B3A10D
MYSLLPCCILSFKHASRRVVVRNCVRDWLATRPGDSAIEDNLSLHAPPSASSLFRMQLRKATSGDLPIALSQFNQPIYPTPFFTPLPAT